MLTVVLVLFVAVEMPFGLLHVLHLVPDLLDQGVYKSLCECRVFLSPSGTVDRSV